MSTRRNHSELAASATTARQTGWRGWVERSTTGLLLIALVYVVLTTAWMVKTHALDFPYWDQWQELFPEDYLRRPYSQHNEHRLFVGRLVFALDAWLFQSRNQLNCAVTQMSLLGTAFLLSLAVASPGNLRRFLPAFALSATLLFAAYSWENLLWSFQASFVPVYPAAIGAFVALTRAPRHWGWLVVALLAATTAAFTVANGLLVAPLLVALALLLGRPRWQVAVLAIFAVALWASYFHGYRSPGHHANPWSELQKPIAVLRYIAIYLGGPLSWRFGQHRILVACILGTLGLGVWLALSIVMLVRRRQLTPADWVLPCTTTLIVGSALLTALGRLNLPLELAMSSRYGTTVFVFWIAMIGQLMRHSMGSSARIWVDVLACVVGVAVGSEQLHHQRVAVARYQGARSAETALQVGALEVESIDQVSPAPYLVEHALPELRARRWSIFSEPWLDWIGQPLSRFVPERDDAACLGILERGRAVASYGGPGFRLEGWALARGTETPPERIVFIDSQGIVRGFALAGQPRRVPEARSRRAGFVGHVGSLPEENVEIVAVALVDDGRRACHLKRSVRLSRATSLELVKPWP